MASTEPSPSLSRKQRYLARFKEGLRRWTGDDDVANYRYYGGDQGRHLSYFVNTLHRRPTDMPDRRAFCVCGIKIMEQCFLEHEPSKELVVVGNCCIRRYVPKAGRTCDCCGEGHRNRRDNLCHACRAAGAVPDRLAPRPPAPPRVYLHVPYESRDEAKGWGARWCPETRRWYAFGGSAAVFRFGLVWLSVPFADKDVAKGMGARWCSESRRWFTSRGAPGGEALCDRFAPSAERR